MGILALISAALQAVVEWLKWQASLAQIQSRKLAYDIDQEQLAKGRSLQEKINSARTAGDLSALSLYLDSQTDAALFAARVRSSVPDSAGWVDVGIGGGIPKGTPAGSGPSDGIKPTTLAKPSIPVK